VVSDLTVEGHASRVAVRARTHWTPGTAPAIDVHELEVDLPGIALGGSAKVEPTQPPKIEVNLEARSLDIKRALALARRFVEHRRRAATANPGLAKLEGVEVSGALRVEALRAGRLEARDAAFRFELKKGVLRLERAKASLLGGAVAFDGTRIDFTGERPAWHLRGAIDGVRIEQALAGIAKKRQFFGALSARLDLESRGWAWREVRETIDGNADVKIVGGEIAGIDLARLVSKEPQVKLDAEEAGDDPRRITRFSDLYARFWVNRGWLRLREPLAF
jgi:hypothetical protein